MNVCVKCRVEMRCDRNEVYAVYGEAHAYPGDRFKCPSCGYEILHTNTKPVFLPTAKNLNADHVVHMSNS